MADEIQCKQVQGDACGEEESKTFILHEQQQTEVSRMEKDLGIMITSDLKYLQQCEYACSKAKRVMGMSSRTISYKEPAKIMFSLYNILVRPHVEYYSVLTATENITHRRLFPTDTHTGRI